jgi:hypothetical protein
MDSDQNQDTSKYKQANTAKNNLSVTRLLRIPLLFELFVSIIIFFMDPDLDQDT